MRPSINESLRPPTETYFNFLKMSWTYFDTNYLLTSYIFTCLFINEIKNWLKILVKLFYFIKAANFFNCLFKKKIEKKMDFTEIWSNKIFF